MSNANDIYFGYAFEVGPGYDTIKVGSHIYSEGDIYRKQPEGDAVQIGIYQKWSHWDGTSRWAETSYTARDFGSSLQFEFNTLEELTADINRDGWEATVNRYAN